MGGDSTQIQEAKETKLIGFGKVTKLTGPLPEIIDIVNTARENRLFYGAAYKLIREHPGCSLHEASCWGGLFCETAVNE